MKTIKERAKAIIFERESDIATAFSRAFALVQEIANAPEPEPVGEAVDFNGWRIVRWKGEESDFPVGTKFYAAPPANNQSEQRLEMVNQSEPSVPDGWKHDCAGVLQNDVELWVDSCPHCGKPRPATPTPAIERELLGENE